MQMYLIRVGGTKIVCRNKLFDQWTHLAIYNIGVGIGKEDCSIYRGSRRAYLTGASFDLAFPYGITSFRKIERPVLALSASAGFLFLARRTR